MKERKKGFSSFLNKGLTFSLGVIHTNNVTGSAHGCQWKEAKKIKNKEEELGSMSINGVCLGEQGAN